ncbi:hypothetical protein [uncultured Shimia sp.]|uniref:hypothetical protein n=1 Tax=uncultured Shimia sp. TaxID=573152 RepID=UPI002611417E|nr:hypothetical protein [uncultured Shimia sp.]
MSYIDGFKHEQVGFLAAIPVYHPLEDIPMPPRDWPEDDFGCTTRQLVIGGGAGEHPGLVVRKPEAAVARFVLESGDFDLPAFLSQKFLQLAEQKDTLHFAGWEDDDHRGFYEACTNGKLPNPYWPSSGYSFEVWLSLGIGEFIYYAMPDLAGPQIEQAKAFHTTLGHVRYNNILCVPPGMPVYANGGNAFFK